MDKTINQVSDTAATVSETKTLRSNFEYFLNAFLNWKEIKNCEGKVYLKRWYLIRTRSFGLFIHRFNSSDEDRALHCHPWNFIVIPVWRGYNEFTESHFKDQYWTHLLGKREKKRRVIPFISISFRSAMFKHRVELIDGKPAWSIFIRFRRIREWGLYPNGKFVHWRKWWTDNKCID